MLCNHNFQRVSALNKSKTVLYQGNLGYITDIALGDTTTCPLPSSGASAGSGGATAREIKGSRKPSNDVISNAVNK